MALCGAGGVGAGGAAVATAAAGAGAGVGAASAAVVSSASFPPPNRRCRGPVLGRGKTGWAAAGAADGTPEGGVALAQEIQRSGKAGEVLKKWIAASQAAKARE